MLCTPGKRLTSAIHIGMGISYAKPMKHLQIKLIYPLTKGRVAKEVKKTYADWPAGGCPSTHALSARDRIKSKSNSFATVINSYFDFDGS